MGRRRNSVVVWPLGDILVDVLRELYMILHW